MESTDSTPFLSNHSSSRNKNALIQCQNHEQKEPLTWSQILQVMLISMASFFESQQTFITIFADNKPSWHCNSGAGAGACSQDSWYNICKIPPESWQWDSPAKASIISDWSLYCESVLSGLPASSFFMGCLAGGVVLGALGDSVGRKKLLFISCLTMSSASILTGLSSNIWMYSSFRAISGLGRAAIGSCVLVLSTESVGEEWRGRVGIVGFLCSTFGYMSLPALAYSVRNYSWRSLYLSTSIPGIVYCILVHFFARESPKWLQEQGNKCENTSQKSSLVKILFDSDRTVLHQLALAMLVGFGVGLVYYGTPLGLGSFNFNLYLSVAMSAVLEVPSAVMTFYLAKCRRRETLVALSSGSGVCGIVSVLVRDWAWLGIGLQLVSFFCACAAFNLLLIYAVELFPVSMRNSSVSLVWQAIVFGGAVCPLILALGEGYSKILPHSLFGVMIFFLGSLVMFLKETVNRPQSSIDLTVGV